LRAQIKNLALPLCQLDLVECSELLTEADKKCHSDAVLPTAHQSLGLKNRKPEKVLASWSKVAVLYGIR
jgi:hypothetical protein